MRSLFATAFAMSALFSAHAAVAQDAPPAEGGGVVYERETVYDFENEYIDGSVMRPDGLDVWGRNSNKQSTLIRIRTDFVPEMVRSVEEL